MEIPKLPTDNLYKFQALTMLLAAIILYGSGIYLFSLYDINAGKECNIEVSRINAESSLIDKLKTDINIEKQKYLTRFGYKADSLRFYAIVNDSAFDAQKEKEFYSKIDALDDKLIALKERKYNLAVSNAVNEQKRDNEDFILYMIVGIALIVVCGFCVVGAIDGFLKWHKNLQVYQDLLLKREAGIYFDYSLENEEELSNQPKSKKSKSSKKTIKPQ
jgi:hypothetical protein